MERHIKAFTGLLIIGLALGATGAHIGIEGETVHEYEIKSEQVEVSSDQNATPLREMNDTVREAVWDAFKKTDHFLGGASATIQTSQKLDLHQSERWQLISIEGVEMLIGISGPSEYEKTTGDSILGTILFVTGGILTLISLLVISEHYAQKKLLGQ